MVLLRFVIHFVFVAEANEGQSRPDIELISANDPGNADEDYQNQETEVPTIYIDKLAASGVSFSSGYFMAPVFEPSSAALLAGRYQQRFGFVDSPGSLRAATAVIPEIPASVKILPEFLNGYGYSIGISSIEQTNLGIYTYAQENRIN